MRKQVSKGRRPVKNSDGDPATTNLLHGTDFAEQVSAETKLSPAAFDSFANALEAAETPNERLRQLFELRQKLIQ